MEMLELIKNSTIIVVELHALFLAIIVLLFLNTRDSFKRNVKKQELSLNLVYICIILMVFSDCIWTCISNLGKPSDVVAYIVNLIYFISSSLGVASWFIFCNKNLKNEFSKIIIVRIGAMLIYGIMLVLYLLSPWYGFIFSIKDGEYVRGSFFYLDPVIKMSFICLSSLLAYVCGLKKEIDCLKKRDFDFAIFGVPVIICGILQTITGVDFNCLGVTLGLVIIYLNGVTNPDRENISTIYSLANSFEASYVVNMETGLMRPLHEDEMHDQNMSGMESNNFEIRFNTILSKTVLPEDRQDTLKVFNIKNIKKRFEIDNSFSIRYRVKESSGQTALHTSFFIHASSESKKEFLLLINTIHQDSLLYERNEILKHENQKLEEMNAGIIESLAKIVEARDSDSGEHVVRVKKITEIIAREMMSQYPEYGLNEEKVKMIANASVLHDIGKIAIPDAILLKPGKLTKEEFAIMKTHSSKGCDMLNYFPLGLDDAFLEYALSICRWHHEKYDGKGYPDGLKGDDIPIAAQIVSVADCFDALTSDRPYKKAFDPDKAIEMIKNNECGVFSLKIIDALEKQRNKLVELTRLYN